LPFTGDAVLKPRDGAGCVDTFRGVPANLPNGRFIVQPWIDGISASVSFMIGPSSCVNLLPVSQRIVERSGKLHYAGGQLPLDEETAKRAIRVGLQAVQAVRGLAGYVGVDVILGDDGRDWAIEINPRITTSYIALRRACQTNLMEALLQVWNGQTPTLAWRDETISFTP
jgi:predicted ATP-grasp superfamily ATP-dependent carboligase